MDAKRIFGGNSKAQKLHLDTSNAQVSFHTTTPSHVTSLVKATIDNMFHVSTKEEVDQKVSRCLYGNGIAFHVMSVVQVVTDNATNCKVVGAIIEDKVVIGEVYEQMDTMLGNMKDILSNDLVVFDLIHNLMVARWDKMNIPLHCLTYMLVPKYYTNAWLAKPALYGVKRRKPYFDSEVQKGFLEAIDKMIREPIEAAMIRPQISDFVCNKGMFAQPQAVNDIVTMNALSWWHLYGGVAPELHSLALKVLSQSVNNSCVERCWSTCSYIHSVKRNRLNVV
ncbi:hypothetical protein L1049_027029 [Liquidambar formosana]|uniref:HAT C-terminal dimerisation domain-containing protein n=1 Tax=Liquidambar formosana TaxID=63359 RepID=A0AAP0R8H6_LIQFO